MFALNETDFFVHRRALSLRLCQGVNGRSGKNVPH